MTQLSKSDNLSEESFNNKKPVKSDTTAVIAESLFLANLLLIPVIPFLFLVYQFKKYAHQTDSIAYNHLKQTLIASVLAGIFIVAIAGIFYFFSNTSAAVTWTIILTYLTCVHSVFVMMGIYGLSKAMVGQKVKFPLIPA
ncbi:MAG: hypothetical protein GY694_17485 [Gammaproteobacteria bacterium]|nr:hypothetical protein [Gammaproteobacteria bacterium]